MIGRVMRLIRGFARNSEKSAQSVGAIHEDIVKQSALLNDQLGEIHNKLNKLTTVLNDRLGEIVVSMLAEQRILSNELNKLTALLNDRLGEILVSMLAEQRILSNKLNKLIELETELPRLLARKGASDSTRPDTVDDSSAANEPCRPSPSVMLEVDADLQIAGEGVSPRFDTDYFLAAAVRLRRGLNFLAGKTQLNVLLFSTRPEYFASDDLLDASDSTIASMTFVASESELQALKKSFDLAIICTHVMTEYRAEFIVRARQMAPLVVAWTWDNHHNPYANLRCIALADLVLPAHRFCSDLMKTPHAVLGRSFALPTSQWSRELTTRLLDGTTSAARSDALYGGFVLWGAPRDELLSDLKNQIPDNAIRIIDGGNRTSSASYFRMSAREQFREWSSYKSSIVLPFANDLSMRLFDALICGQVPIVPESCYDLDGVVPPDIQAKLPIIRFKESSVSSIREAWRSAILEYDRMGIEGVYHRHRFARDHHHISVRLGEIVRYVGRLASKPVRIAVKVDEAGVGLVFAPGEDLS